MKIGTYRWKNGNLKRDGEGRFTSFLSKCKKVFKFVVRWTAVAGVGYALILVGIFYHRTTATEKIVEVDNLTPKVQELKNKVVADIQSCESRGHKESDGIIIFDSNAEASIGTMQFQRKTVIHYYKTLYGKTITPKEAILIALDDEKAEALAHDIIFKDSKGVNNWYNCANKINAKGRISTIKELAK